jgi:hypothetical protein
MALNGSQINNEIQQLTVRELEEAKKYKLTRSDYVQLRSSLVEQNRLRAVIEKNLREDKRFLAIVSEGLKASVKEEVIPEVRKELKPQIRKEVEEELGKKCQAEALEKLNAEKPNRERKLAYVAYLRELESETGALAETASELSDKLKDRRSINKYARGGIMTISWLGLLPTALYLLSIGWSHGSMFFWGVLASIVIIAAWFSIVYVNTRDFLTEENRSMEKVSSDYLKLTDDARRVRMAVVPTAKSTTEMSESVQAIVSAKKKLDDCFCPSTKVLNETRKKVRVKMLDEIDPMEVLKAVDDDSRQASSEEWLESEENRGRA